MSSRPLVCAVSALAALGVRSVHAASASPGSSLVVDSFHGALQTKVDFRIPAFRGLEPPLRLDYSSSGRAGEAGVGWSLSGFSTIERVSPGGGAPTYGMSDAFTLDGEELTPCASAGPSPGCAAGGTHTTRRESWSRIRKESDSLWTVTTRSGVTSRFTPVYWGAQGTFRWGITAVEDRRHNQVSFGWICDPAADCYPRTVSYAGYRVDLFWEPRPDEIELANGAYLGMTRWRLRSVVVRQQDGALIRAYGLGYTTSAATGRSLLATVREHGRDASVDANGRVSGGTTAPALDFAYQTDPQSGSFTLPAAPPGAPAGTVETARWFTRRCVAENGNALYKPQTPECNDPTWNAGASSTRAIGAGDGYMEFSDGCQHWVHGDLMAGLSSNDAHASFEDIDYAIRLFEEDGQLVYGVVERGVAKGTFGSVGHESGDVFRVAVTGGVVRYLRNGVVFYTSLAAPAFPLRASVALKETGISGVENVRVSGALVDIAGWCATGERSLGDYDGDGRADLKCHDATGTFVRLGRGTSFDPPVLWTGALAAGTHGEGDFDGDGKIDLWRQDLFTGDFLIQRSTGSGFAPPVSWVGNGVCRVDPNTFVVQTGDFNGDGKTDVGCVRTTDGGVWDGIWVGLSTGTSFQHGRWLDACSIALDNGVGDFDGDGKDDWTCQAEDGSFAIQRSTGSAFEHASLTGTYLPAGSCPGNAWIPADLDGDGKQDLVCQGTGQIFLSIGRRFAATTASSGFCQGTGDQLFTGDFNGDGLGDLGCNRANAPADDTQVRISSGSALAAATTWRASWCLGSVRASDLDGDRKTDLWCDEALQQIALGGTSGRIPDLLMEWKNGIGGVWSAAYAPSSSFVNTNNPPVVPVLTSLAVSDGRGNVATTTYQYAGGLQDRQGRRFLGFRLVSERRPCAAAPCPVVNTYYLQDYAALLQVERIDRLDGAQRLLESDVNQWATGGAAPPYASLKTAEWHLRFDGSGAVCQTWPCTKGRRLAKTFGYDAWGNTILEVDHGDFDVAGDEDRIERIFVPNLTAFVTDAPAVISHFAGVTGSALLDQRVRHYDFATHWSVAPSTGFATAIYAWHDRSNSYTARWLYPDAPGNLAVSIDEASGISSLGYDAERALYPTTLTNAAEETMTVAWDPACGQPIRWTDASGSVVTQAHDPLCRPTLTSSPLGRYESRSYVAGDPGVQHVRLETSGPSGPLVSTQRFDGLGRVVEEEAAGARVDIAYGPNGQVASRTEPYAPGETPIRTQWEQDALGRVTRIIAPGGGETVFGYTHDTERTRDPHGDVTEERRDARGRVVLSTQFGEPQPLLTRSTWSLGGDRIGLEDPAGNRWSWSYDSLGRLVEERDPDLGQRQYTHDGLGRVLSRTDAKGQVMTYQYDGVGRIVREESPDGAVTFQYGEPRDGFNNGGRLTTMIDPAGSTRYDWDALGRAVRQRRTLGETEYTRVETYGPSDHVLATTYPDGTTISRGYDAAGRLSTIPGFVTSIVYDAAGRPTTQRNANGTRTDFTRDPATGWLTRIRTTADGRGGVPQDLRYTLDVAGLVTQVTGTRPEEQWGYRYDRFHRLISAEGAASEVFRYDLAGNLLESHAGAYTYPPPGSPQPHTPASVGGMRFLYDANGNLLDGNGRSLTWDAHDRPRTVDNATVVYDGVGRRLSLSGGHSITRWPVGDDYEVQDGMPTIYVSGPRGLLARQSAGQKVWLHTDRLGSVHVVTSESGEVVKWRSYRPYGEVLAEAGNDQESRGFTGARRDLSGLHHLGARSYDPGLGLFASADPSDPTEAGVGTNRYAYTAGNPTNATDPTGLRWDCRVSEQQDGKGSTIVTVTCHYVPDRSGSAGSTGGGSGGRGGGNGRGGGGRGGGRGQAPTPPKEPTLPSEPSQPSDPSDPSDPGTTDNPSSMSVDENGNVTRTEYVEVEGITPVSQSYIEVDFVAGNGVNFLPGPVKGALRPAMGRFGDVDGDIYPEVMRNVYLGFMAVCKDKRLACHSKFHDRSRRRYQ